MTIDADRIYLVDLYQATDLTGTSSDFEFPKYTPTEAQKNVIAIKFKHYYVPLKSIKNMLTYLTLKLEVKTNTAYKDGRFLTTEPNFDFRCNRLYVQNVEPMFKDSIHKYTLKKLNKLQTILTATETANKKEKFIIDAGAL